MQLLVAEYRISLPQEVLLIAAPLVYTQILILYIISTGENYLAKYAPPDGMADDR
jgi:hypothetical protein